MKRRQKGGATVGACLESEALSVAGVSLTAGTRPRLTFAERVAVADSQQHKIYLEELLRRGKLHGRSSHLILHLNSYQTMPTGLLPQQLKSAGQRW